jgi:hypothetical protein
MLGLFKSKPYSDPQLGTLSRSKGMWRGSIQLPDSRPAPLVLAGDRSQPDSAALSTVRQMATDFPGWRSAIESALFEHYSPYGESVSSGERTETEDWIPHLVESGQVWQHASLDYVAVLPLQGTLTVELGYRIAWDREHCLGARFQQGRLVELNGSVLPP